MENHYEILAGKTIIFFKHLDPDNYLLLKKTHFGYPDSLEKIKAYIKTSNEV